MSSFLRKTQHPQTKEWETAAWVDDHFGRHQYGVKFLDGQVFNAQLYDLPTTEENVDYDWAKFFPESVHEALPSEEKPQEAQGPRRPTDQEEQVREQLAAIEHERWSDWQRWVHKIMRFDLDDNDEEVALIPVEVVNQWERQINTPYEQLTAKEKASDMEQVDRYWPLIQKYVEQAKTAARIKLLWDVRGKFNSSSETEFEDWLLEELKGVLNQ